MFTFRNCLQSCSLLLCMSYAASVYSAPTSCNKTLNIRAVQAAPLSFGDLLVSGAGTVSIDTLGSRSTTGSLTLANGTVSAAELSVNGCWDTPYSINIQASTTLSSTTDSLVVDNFITDPVVGLLDSKGKQRILIGATLHVRADQTAGAYSGVFIVEVIYQ